jgi:hypothetical protein
VKQTEFWMNAELHDRDGLLVATVRVKCFGTPPNIVQWGPRHFWHAFPSTRYNEASFYFIPLENAYAAKVQDPLIPPKKRGL